MRDSCGSAVRATAVAIAWLALLCMVLVYVPPCGAFDDTPPLLAFSARTSQHGSISKRGSDTGVQQLLERATNTLHMDVASGSSQPALHARDVVRALTTERTQLCALDAVAIVEIDGLDTHTFRKLPIASPLRARVLDAPSQLVLPYVSDVHGAAPSLLRHAVLRSCPDWHAPNSSTLDDHDFSSQHAVISIRTDASDPHFDKHLDKYIEELSSRHPNHLVLFAAAEPMLHSKRSVIGSAHAASSAVARGIFHQYQLFSTGLLIAICVVALLLIPITLFTARQLANIAIPDRLGEQPQRVSTEKKAQ